MSDSKLFFGGTPTAPQVKKLIETFGAPEPGCINYSDIAECIGEKVRSNRFRTVVNSWRNELLKKYNLATRAVSSVGILVMQEGERVDDAGSKLQRSIKAVRSAGKRVHSVDTTKLDQAALTKHTHLKRYSTLMFEAVNAENKKLRAEVRAIEQLPRRATG